MFKKIGIKLPCHVGMLWIKQMSSFYYLTSFSTRILYFRLQFTWAEFTIIMLSWNLLQSRTSFFGLNFFTLLRQERSKKGGEEDTLGPSISFFWSIVYRFFKYKSTGNKPRPIWYFVTNLIILQDEFIRPYKNKSTNLLINFWELIIEGKIIPG